MLFRSSLFDEIRSLITGWTVVFLGLLAFIVFTKYGDYYSRTWLLLWYIFGLLALIVSRIILRTSLGYLRRESLNQRHFVLVGSGELEQRVASKIRAATWTGLSITGFFSDLPNQHRHCQATAGIPNFGGVPDVVSYVEEHDINQVWITISLKHTEKTRNIIDELHTVAVDIRLILDIFNRSNAPQRIQFVMHPHHANLAAFPHIY